jgi:hypothetical protein
MSTELVQVTQNLQNVKREYEEKVKVLDKLRQDNDEQKSQKWENKIEDLEA